MDAPITMYLALTMILSRDEFFEALLKRSHAVMAAPPSILTIHFVGRSAARLDVRQYEDSSQMALLVGLESNQEVSYMTIERKMRPGWVFDTLVVPAELLDECLKPSITVLIDGSIVPTQIDTFATGDSRTLSVECDAKQRALAFTIAGGRQGLSYSRSNAPQLR